MRRGVEHILLSDRKINSRNVPIPMLLVVGAVHTHLVRQGLRSFVSINVQSSDVLDVHSFAVLIGIGATTINPYLVERTIFDRYGKKNFSKINTQTAIKNYKTAINQGLCLVILYLEMM